MTSPARFTASAAAAVRDILGNPARCLTIPGSAGGDPATSCAAALRPQPVRSCPAARHRAREAIPAGAIAIVPAVLVLALLAGCSARGTVLTARTSRLGPAAAAPSPAAAAQVITAYTAYFPALTAAEPQPQAKAAGTLAPYAAQPYLGHVLAQMAWYQAHGEVAWGYFVPHVTSVQITGSQAVVRDCQDASNAWLVSTTTGEVIPGTAGSARTYLVATLARGGGERWRLTFLAYVGGPCTPVPSPS
jgi:hypothetical protein